MSEKKIVVPEGMINAVDAALSLERGWRHELPAGIARDATLQAALRWMSENPIVPTEQQALDMATGCKFDSFENWELVRWGACEWQRRMFLAPDPEIPQEIADLCNENGPNSPRWKAAIIESYRRGQQSKGNS